MKYVLNPSAMLAPFFVPASVVDKHIKLATENQLRVLLTFLKNVSIGPSPKFLADALKLEESEVIDALNFWVEREVIALEGENIVSSTAETTKPTAVRPAVIKPSDDEIILAAEGDPKIAFLIQEAEMKLSRLLRKTERQTLCWLYLDHGMDVSLILMLVEYAVSEGKATVAFIENTALSWIAAGVTTLSDAEEQIELRNRKKTAWGIVTSAFGMEYRMPSDKELEFVDKWIGQWNFKKELLREAYNICIDKNAKLSMAYINKILEKWHKDGIKTVEATKLAAKSKNGQNGFGVYDKNLVENLLNKDD